MIKKIVIIILCIIIIYTFLNIDYFQAGVTNEIIMPMPDPTTSYDNIFNNIDQNNKTLVFGAQSNYSGPIIYNFENDITIKNNSIKGMNNQTIIFQNVNTLPLIITINQNTNTLSYTNPTSITNIVFKNVTIYINRANRITNINPSFFNNYNKIINNIFINNFQTNVSNSKIISMKNTNYLLIKNNLFLSHDDRTRHSSRNTIKQSGIIIRHNSKYITIKNNSFGKFNIATPTTNTLLKTDIEFFDNESARNKLRNLLDKLQTITPFSTITDNMLNHFTTCINIKPDSNACDYNNLGGCLPSNITISNNIIRDSPVHNIKKDHAIYGVAFKQVKIINNLIQGWPSGRSGGIKFRQCEKLVISNNTLNECGIYLYVYVPKVSCIQNWQLTNIYINNNIIINPVEGLIIEQDFINNSDQNRIMSIESKNPLCSTLNSKDIRPAVLSNNLCVYQSLIENIFIYNNNITAVNECIININNRYNINDNNNLILYKNRVNNNVNNIDNCTTGIFHIYKRNNPGINSLIERNKNKYIIEDLELKTLNIYINQGINNITFFNGVFRKFIDTRSEAKTYIGSLNKIVCNTNFKLSQYNLLPTNACNTPIAVTPIANTNMIQATLNESNNKYIITRPEINRLNAGNIHSHYIIESIYSNSDSNNRGLVP